MSKLPRRTVLTTALATAALASCAPSPKPGETTPDPQSPQATEPTSAPQEGPGLARIGGREPFSWVDGVPERPERKTKDTAVCDIVPWYGKPFVSGDGKHAIHPAPFAPNAKEHRSWHWDLTAGTAVELLGHAPKYGGYEPDNCVFLPDNSTLTVATDCLVHQTPAATRHFRTGHELLEPPCSGVVSVKRIVPSPDGRYVCTAGHDGTVAIFDLQENARLARYSLTNEKGEKVVAQLSATDKHFLIGSTSTPLYVLSPQGELVQEVSQRVTRFAFPAGRVLFVDPKESPWMELDQADWSKQSLKADLPNGWDIQLDPTGKYAVASQAQTSKDVGPSSSVTITEIATGEQIEIQIAGEHWGFALASPNALLAATPSGLQTYDVESGAPVATLENPK